MGGASVNGPVTLAHSRGNNTPFPSGILIGPAGAAGGSLALLFVSPPLAVACRALLAAARNEACLVIDGEKDSRPSSLAFDHRKGSEGEIGLSGFLSKPTFWPHLVSQRFKLNSEGQQVVLDVSPPLQPWDMVVAEVLYSRIVTILVSYT